MKVFLTSRAFLILSLLWLSSIPTFAFFQNSSARVKTKYEFTDPRISEADTLLKKRQYQEALEAYQKAYDTYESESFYEGMVYAKERSGYSHRRSGYDQMAREDFQKSIKLAQEHLDQDHPLLAKAYLSEGVRRHRKDDFLVAAQFLDTAMRIYESSLYYDSAVYGQMVNYKFYTYLFSNQSADTLVKYLNERGRIFDHAKVDLDNQIYLLSDYSRAYYQIGDYAKAVAYALEAVKVSEQNEGIVTPLYYTDALFNLGRSLNSLQELEKALDVANKLINYTVKVDPKSASLLSYYNLKAVVLNGLKRYPQAAVQFKRIIQTMEDRGEFTLFYRSSVMNLGVCYQLMGDFEKSEFFLLKALELEKEVHDIFDISLSDRYEYLGQLYKSKKDFELSLRYYDSALRSNLRSTDIGVFDFPKEKDFSVRYEVLRILKNKQINMTSIYEEQGSDRTDLLLAGIEYTERTHNYLMDNRRDLEVSKGKLFLSENFKSLYENGIEAAYHLYNKHPANKDYFLKALSFFSYSKSILFLEQSGELGMVQDDRLPIELKNRYYDLKAEVDELEERFNILIDEIVNSDSLRKVNTKLMSRASNLKLLSDSISKVIGNDVVQGLSRKTQMDSWSEFAQNGRGVLEYFVGNESLFIIGISNGIEFFKRVDLTEEFDTAFDWVLQAISTRPTIQGYAEVLRDYKLNAHLLYKVLLEDAMKIFGPNLTKLTIVPDERLSKLPFEALLTSSNEAATSYAELDYVMNSVSINYALSSMELLQKGVSRRAEKMLFGVGYSGNVYSEERSRAGLGALPGTEKEIRYLQENVEGDFFLGLEGTKNTFLTKAKDYDILHLAVHGEADSTNRYLSSLIFNGSNGVLKTSDLYSADLSARLAILSACESGIGQINKGEGTFSIARGFALVGVPSVVMSLWNVNDQVAADLMVEFHQRLQEGASVNSALTESKRSLISNSDEYISHPYYWSAFVSLGQDIDLKDDSKYLNQALIYGILIAATLTLLYLARKKEKGL